MNKGTLDNAAFIFKMSQIELLIKSDCWVGNLGKSKRRGLSMSTEQRAEREREESTVAGTTLAKHRASEQRGKSFKKSDNKAMLWNAHTKCWSKFKHPHCFWSNSMFLVNGGLDWEKGVQFWVGRGLSEAKPSHLAQRLHVLFLVESLLTLTASDPQSESSDDGVVCDQQGGGEHLWSLRPMIGPVRTTFRWNLSDQLSIYRTFDRFERTVVYSRKGEQRCEWNKIRSEFLFLKGCVCSTTYRVFFNWYPPEKLKYGKPRLGESTLT